MISYTQMKIIKRTNDNGFIELVVVNFIITTKFSLKKQFVLTEFINII